MGRPKSHQQEQRFSGLRSYLKKKGKGGQWAMLSEPLVQFMGLRDALWLTGWDTHYQKNCDSLKRDGSFHCSVRGFRARYGLKQVAQKGADKNVRKLGLYKRSKLKAEDNSRNIIYNNIAVYIFVSLIYKYKHELQYEHRKGSEKGLPATQAEEELRKLYKAMLKYKSLRGRFRNFVKEIEGGCKPEDFENFDKSKTVDDNALDYFSEEIDLFYEEFIEWYKKLTKS